VSDAATNHPAEKYLLVGLDCNPLKTASVTLIEGWASSSLLKLSFIS
jgi:hypothetical protein